LGKGRVLLQEMSRYNTEVVYVWQQNLLESHICKSLEFIQSAGNGWAIEYIWPDVLLTPLTTYIDLSTVVCIYVCKGKWKWNMIYNITIISSIHARELYNRPDPFPLHMALKMPKPGFSFLYTHGVPKQKLPFPVHQISWVIDWLSEWLITPFFSMG